MVGASPQTDNQWLKKAGAGGRSALRAIPRPGRPPYVTVEIADPILGILGSGALHYGYSTDLWTLPGLREVVEKECGLRYSKTGLWGILKAYNVSWQRPRRQAREKEVRAVRSWPRRTRPRLKRKPIDGALWWCVSTKVGSPSFRAPRRPGHPSERPRSSFTRVDGRGCRRSVA